MEYNPEESKYKNVFEDVPPDTSQNEEYKRLMNEFKRKYYVPLAPGTTFIDLLSSGKKPSKSPYILEQSTLPLKETTSAMQYKVIDLRNFNFPSESQRGNVVYRVNSLLDSKNLTQRQPVDISKRCDVWLKAKEKRMKELKDAKLSKEMEECTFKPARITEKSKLASAYESAVESKNEALYKYSLVKDQEKFKANNETPAEELNDSFKE